MGTSGAIRLPGVEIAAHPTCYSVVMFKKWLPLTVLVLVATLFTISYTRRSTVPDPFDTGGICSCPSITTTTQLGESCCGSTMRANVTNQGLPLTFYTKTMEPPADVSPPNHPQTETNLNFLALEFDWLVWFVGLLLIGETAQVIIHKQGSKHLKN